MDKYSLKRAISKLKALKCHLTDWKVPLTSQVKFLLFCSKTHFSFANYYKRLHESSGASTRGSGRQPEVRGPDDEKSKQESPEAHRKWDWRGVPEIWPLLRHYTHLSTIWMVFTLIKTLFGEQLFKLAHLLTGYPGHCVILGRFVLHPTVAGLAAFCMAMFHVSWRLLQHHKRPNMMSLFAFMLQSERNLEQFYAIMRANHDGDYLEGPAAAGDLLQERKQQQQQHAISAEEQFFRHILCYEVHLDSGRVVYKLRPNRKRESRAHLDAHMRRAMMATTYISLSIAIPFSMAITLLLLSDLRYVQTFPGCSAALDHLYTSGQLTSFWSWTFTWHRAVSLVFDCFENAFIWFDSGIGTTFVLTVTYLLDYDTLFYWRHLHAHIQLSLARARAHHEREQAQQQRALRHPITQLSNIMGGYLSEHQLPRLPARMSLERHLIETEINELQCEIFDFFRQVERADQFIGDDLSMAVVIWLCSFSIPSYYYLVRVSSSEFPSELRALQLMGFLIISIFTHRLLRLNQCCMKSYQLICSLMAYDQSSTSTRLKFIQIIEFFTRRKATTYKLFQRIPYLATTYLTIIGWSFSSMVICNSLFGRERPLTADANYSTRTLSPMNNIEQNVLILGGSKYSAFSSSL